MALASTWASASIPFEYCINTCGPKSKVKVLGLLPFLAPHFKVTEYFTLIGVEMITDISY